MKFTFTLITFLCLLFHVYIYVVSLEERVLQCGDVGGNVTLVCHFSQNYKESNVWFRGTDDHSRIEYIDKGKVAPNLKDKIKARQNNNTAYFDLEVTNILLDDEGNYTCQTSNNNKLVQQIVYLKIIGADCSSYKDCQNTTDFHSSRCADFNTTTSNDTISYWTAISYWDVGIISSLSSFLLIIILYSVTQFRRRSNIDVYDVGGPSGNEPTEINLNDVHVYHEIKETEIVISGSEHPITNIPHSSSDNDDDRDYLHPYSSLSQNRQQENHKYESLSNVYVQSNSLTNNEVDKIKNVNQYPKRKLRHELKMQRLLYLSSHNVGDLKQLFYSVPSNIDKYLFPRSLSENDITARRQLNTVLDVIDHIIANKLASEKQIDDNISLD